MSSKPLADSGSRRGRWSHRASQGCHTGKVPEPIRIRAPGASTPCATCGSPIGCECWAWAIVILTTRAAAAALEEMDS